MLCQNENRMSGSDSIIPLERPPPASSVAETAGKAASIGLPIIALLIAGYVGYTDNQSTKQQQKDLSELSIRIDDEITKTIAERTERIMQTVNALDEKLKAAEDALKKSSIEVQTLQQQLRRQEDVLEVLGYPSPLSHRNPPASAHRGQPRYDSGYGGRPPPDGGYDAQPRYDGGYDGSYDGGYDGGYGNYDAGYGNQRREPPRAPPRSDSGYSRPYPPSHGAERRSEQPAGGYGRSFTDDIASL